MARKHKAEPAGFAAVPADGGMSIDRLAQAFAAMMGQAESALPAEPASVVEVDASPDLDAEPESVDGAVSPRSILEALLFVGLSGGRPLSSQVIAGLMRGVEPHEIDGLAADLGRSYRADNCPYDVVARAGGWLLRLRPEYAQLGTVLAQKAKQVRLDADSLDVLAVVAWHQPVPRDKLVEFGCDAPPAILRALVRRGLLALEKPAAADGPPAYLTTQKFLDVFKLESLADLPRPDEPPS